MMCGTLAYSYTRFSSRPQEQGDSVRRQISLAESYAEKHGLKLDTSLRDLGRSAYASEHRKGALGAFLAAVESGVIASGSIMLVESVDRVSREHVLDSLSLFTTILNNGIKIITLEDNSEYTRDSINKNGQIYLLVGKIQQAHSESSSKSCRVGAAWSNKKKMAADHNIPMTSICPYWLRLADDRKTFIVVPDRAAVVVHIFRDTAAGMGKERIAARLNATGVETFSVGVRSSVGSGWHASYVQKILQTRSVIGEYQPHIRNSTTNKKRLPVGEVIPNYFPAIVDDALFIEAQKAKTSRRKTGGKQSRTIANLFSNLARCVACGGVMTYRAKGEGCNYLLCDSAIRRRGCQQNRAIPYTNIEAAALKRLAMMDSNGLFKNNKPSANVQALKLEATRLTMALEAGEKALMSWLSQPMTERIQRLLAARQTELDTIESQSKDIKRQIKEASTISLCDDASTVSELKQQAEAGDVDARMKVRTALRSLIERVDVDVVNKYAAIYCANDFVFAVYPNGYTLDIERDEGTTFTINKFDPLPHNPQLVRQYVGEALEQAGIRE